MRILPGRSGQERFRCLSKEDSKVPFCRRTGKWFWLETRKGNQSLHIAIGLQQSTSWWLCQPPRRQGQGKGGIGGLPSSLAKDQLETRVFCLDLPSRMTTPPLLSDVHIAPPLFPATESSAHQPWAPGLKAKRERIVRLTMTIVPAKDYRRINLHLRTVWHGTGRGWRA